MQNEPIDGEPVFTLMARDPHAPILIRIWADQRRAAIVKGERDEDDLRKCSEADEIADRMEEWRRVHNGEWRIPDESEGRARYNEG